jgi:transcription antitermination factor NusG
VAHTKPRQEKALGDSLLALEIACFVPLVRKVRYYAHRRRESELPLFPGYAFLHATREQVIEAYRTERVAQMLPVENQGLLEHELRQLDLALAGGAELDPFPGLGIGRRAAVTAGPFKGIEGTVDERLSSDRLILNVSMLGRAMSLEIDASLLEPVE